MKKLIIVLMMLIPTLCFAEPQQEKPEWNVNCTIAYSFASSIMSAYRLMGSRYTVEERTKAITNLVHENVANNKKVTEEAKKRILDDQLYIVNQAADMLVLLPQDPPTQEDIDTFANSIKDICEANLLPSQVQHKGGHYE